MLNLGFIKKKNSTGSLFNRLFTAVSYQSPLSNFVDTKQTNWSNTCQFFEMIGFFDLMAGNKTRTEVLPSAIAHVAHLCNQFNLFLL